MRKITLSLDDFSITHNNLDLLLQLKSHFPTFKVSLFTIPIDKPMDYGPYLNRAESLKEIKKHLDWLQLIPHGLTHDGRESIWSKEQFRNEIVIQIIQAFNKDELPFARGFKSPHYFTSDGVREALKEMGWKLYEKEGYALHEPWPEGDLKLRGHVYGCADDLGRNMDKLLALPQSVIWEFIT